MFAGVGRSWGVLTAGFVVCWISVAPLYSDDSFGSDQTTFELPPPVDFRTERLAVVPESLTTEPIATETTAQTKLDSSPDSQPDQMAPVKPATPPKPAAPKKPAPPAFPGPLTLPPVGPWKLMYYDNDFSYKKDPNHEYLFGEELKDMPAELFGVPLLISTGGEVRHKYVNEDNRLRPGGPGHTDYNQIRWRHYLDARYGDFRVYAEGIEADTFGSTMPTQAIDVNRWDIQNLFVDWKFQHDDEKTQTLRYGRQELVFGRQRLVSPLDWANTRRNFEGGRYILKGQAYQFDLFCVHPVNSATGFQPVSIYADRFDQPNYHVWFSGAYYNYTGIKNTTIDAYWLYLDTTTILTPGFPYGKRHTFGSRYGTLIPVDGDSRVWDFDTEGAIQVGSEGSDQVLAGFYTAVGGHTWKAAPWTPRLSTLFYWGSGNRSAASGTNSTFNTLFPLGHAYWALSDNLTGENLFDYAIQADVKPTSKFAWTTAYHWMRLASGADTVYTVSGTPFGSPNNGRDLGTALDTYGYYAFSKSFDVQAGMSWFFYGSYFDAFPRGDATQFYVQTTMRY